MPESRSKKKVLILVTRLNIGGVAKYVVQLADCLRKLGYDPRVVAGHIGEGEGDMAYYARRFGIAVQAIPELSRSLRWSDDLVAAVKIFRLIRRWQPEVVHTHTAKAGTLGRLAAWLARTPRVLHTYHGHVFHGYFSPWKSRLVLAVERVLARLTDDLLVLSPSQLRELRDLYKLRPRGDFVLVPLGFEVAEFAGQAAAGQAFRRELGLPEGTPLFGFIGRLTAIKNPHLFLQIARLVHEKQPQAQFLLVGGGELEPSLRATVDEMKLHNNVHFLGWQQDLRRIYAALDALVLTSKNEGTPYTILEAMAAGCPVVATRVGGMPDIVQHGQTGFLFPENAPQEALQAILKLLGEAEHRQQITGTAKDFVQRQFGVEAFQERIAELFEVGEIRRRAKSLG